MLRRERTQDAELGKMVMVHHDPFVLTLAHRLRVDEVNLRSGTEFLRQDWFDDNYLGSCPFSFSLALDAHGLEQGNSILCDVGVLLVDLLGHLDSSSMTSSDVGALDDVKGHLDGSEVQWMFLVWLLSDVVKGNQQP